MNIFAIFGTSFLVALTGAMAPGPLLTVTLAESARRGKKAGPLLVAGHAALELLLVTLLVLGLAPFLSRPQVVAVIGIVGGLFLFWMGASLLRDVIKGRLVLDLGAAGNRELAGVVGGGAGKLIGLGAAVSLANPYWSLWWATVGFAYLTVALRMGLLGVGAFFTGHILADFLWYSVVAWMIASGHRFLGPRFYRGVLGLSGIFLLGLAGYFVLSGLRFQGVL
ncbi:Lysine exporter protein (LYSE/YGGA) [Ammonifex degensii KC4]|uniref:Lysine exporter protein (LYSE/YGGA) n=1 Tax=Ammonifex degensii (strain DSM 10501 / KC4) TaxID=429009 RepID=C9RAW1_AMMDK|nr:LysE family transporter [Ammonifex degensii]ACX51388.1 Lysine exporter protein (LYSE/YGGA) [Ammonifex degensii KC4]